MYVYGMTGEAMSEAADDVVVDGDHDDDVQSLDRAGSRPPPTTQQLCCDPGDGALPRPPPPPPSGHDSHSAPPPPSICASSLHYIYPAVQNTHAICNITICNLQQSVISERSRSQ